MNRNPNDGELEGRIRGHLQDQDPTDPDGLRNRIVEAIRREELHQIPHVGPRRGSGIHPRSFAAAAGLLILLGVGLAMSLLNDPDPTDPLPNPPVSVRIHPVSGSVRIAGDTAQTGQGETGSIRFDDRSEATLRPTTRLAVESRPGERAILMEAGSAIFLVVPGTDPFVVATPYGEIRVLGTEFEVTVRPEGQGGEPMRKGRTLLQIIVWSGLVQIVSPLLPEGPATIQAGDRLEIVSPAPADRPMGIEEAKSRLDEIAAALRGGADPQTHDALVSELIGLLNHEGEFIRRQAVQVLSTTRDLRDPPLSEDHYRAILAHLTGDDALAQAAAATCLGYLHSILPQEQLVAILPVLYRLRDSSDPEVRSRTHWTVGTLLRQLDDEGGIPLARGLVEDLESDSPTRRARAAHDLSYLVDRLDLEGFERARTAVHAILVDPGTGLERVRYDPLLDGLDWKALEIHGLGGTLEAVEIDGRGTLWRIGPFFVTRIDEGRMAGLNPAETGLAGQWVRATGRHRSISCYSCVPHVTEIAHGETIFVVDSLAVEAGPIGLEGEPLFETLLAGLLSGHATTRAEAARILGARVGSLDPSELDRIREAASSRVATAGGEERLELFRLLESIQILQRSGERRKPQSNSGR